LRSLPPVPFRGAIPTARGQSQQADDDYKKQSSSNGGRPSFGCATRAENHSGAAALREKHEISNYDFAAVRAAYEKLTGNLWSQSDSETYAEHGLDQVPVERIISALEAASQRSPVKINSFKYFVKEITALPDPPTGSGKRNTLETSCGESAIIPWVGRITRRSIFAKT
jgi:hypothetical protein